MRFVSVFASVAGNLNGVCWVGGGRDSCVAWAGEVIVRANAVTVTEHEAPRLVANTADDIKTMQTPRAPLCHLTQHFPPSGPQSTLRQLCGSPAALRYSL